MKKLFVFFLAFALTVTLTACGGNSTPPVSTTQPSAASSNENTIPTDASDNQLPNGYKLEVEQTGQRSGVIRLTDPNLQKEYAFYDKAFDEDESLFVWYVMLTDSLAISTVHFNSPTNELESQGPDAMQTSLWKIDANGDMNRAADAEVSVSEKTLTWKFAIPDEYSFSWADITEYVVRVENKQQDVYVEATVPVPLTTSNNAQSDSPSSSTTTAPSSTDTGKPTFQLPDPFETNSGDAEYFAPSTDNYVIVKVDKVQTDSEYIASSGVIMLCFDEKGNTISAGEKWIMSSEQDAKALSQSIADRGGWVNQLYQAEHIQSGNVLYITWSESLIEYMGFKTKTDFETKRNKYSDDYKNKGFTDHAWSDYYYSKS